MQASKICAELFQSKVNKPIFNVNNFVDSLMSPRTQPARRRASAMHAIRDLETQYYLHNLVI